MSNLESIVPPLEDCQKIPAGSFADSIFVWHRYNPKDHWGIAMRGIPGETFPAPTLAEIMAQLPKTMDLSVLTLEPTFDDDGDGWAIFYDDDHREPDTNPVAAALRLWLKVGVK